MTSSRPASRSCECEWIHEDVIPFLTCDVNTDDDVTFHSLRCAFSLLRPKVGSNIKFYFFKSNLFHGKFVLNFFKIYFHLLFRVQQRTALKMASIESILFFKIDFFRFLFRYFFIFHFLFFLCKSDNQFGFFIFPAFNF